MAKGWLVLNGYNGQTRQRVEVIGMTRTKYRIEAIERTKLGGRNRWLEPGQTALVPQTAVRDNCQRCNGVKGGAPGNENLIDGLRTCDYCHADQRRTRR